MDINKWKQFMDYNNSNIKKYVLASSDDYVSMRRFLIGSKLKPNSKGGLLHSATVLQLKKIRSKLLFYFILHTLLLFSVLIKTSDIDQYGKI